MAYLSLATGEGDVHETAGVRESLLGTALGGLGLLLLLNLFTRWVSRLSGMRLESSSRVSGVVFPRLMELRWNCKYRRVEPWQPWLGEEFALSSGWVANWHQTRAFEAFLPSNPSRPSFPPDVRQIPDTQELEAIGWDFRGRTLGV